MTTVQPCPVDSSRGMRAIPSPARPELLRVRSDGRKLSFGVVVSSYAYHDLLLRKEGEAQLLVGSDRGWVALPAKPGEAVELFIRFEPDGGGARGHAHLETYRARISCPESGSMRTLAELGVIFERYLAPL